MIQVRVVYDADKGEGMETIARVSIRGHSNYAEKGHDIVCAAVSVLAQAVFMGAERHLGIEPKATVADGHFVYEAETGAEGDSFFGEQLLLKTLVTALEDIASQYPDFVRLRSSFI